MTLFLSSTSTPCPVGHTSTRTTLATYWHPTLTDTLLGTRHGTAIFHPVSVQKALLQAFYVCSLVFQQRGHLLVVNTHPDSTHIIRSLFAGRPNISYCSSKWIGGTLTNWKQISKSILTFATFARTCTNYLQKHHIQFPRYKKVRMQFEGFLAPEHTQTSQNFQDLPSENHSKKSFDSNLLGFSKIPDLILIVNPNENRHLIHEANKLHIPIISFVQSNTNLQGITYPIPWSLNNSAFLVYVCTKIIKISQRAHGTL